jgi:tetrahydromethanopterin S-methyltransferase subunit G
LRRVQAAEDKLEAIQDRIDRLERLVEILRKENK